MSAAAIAIVGAGPAGLATARAYREHGGAAEVMMLGAETLAPYRRPPLTKEFLRGELDAAELPIEESPWFERNAIDLRLGCEASAIDPEAGTVEIEGGVLRAERIVLATGAEPSRPQIPGAADVRVRTVRERRDSEAIARDAQAGSRAVVLGTGFIGGELAASLALRGCAVTLVGREAAPQRKRLGPAAAARIAEWLAELGVALRMKAEVAAIRDGRTVLLADGSEIEAEQVVLGFGVRPRSELAEGAGLALAEGAVRVDARMHAHERVLAAGDVAFAHNQAAGRPLRVEHWGDALGQGQVAGRVLAGEDALWADVPGFWSTIGRRTVKYAAWGDGHDECRLEDHDDGAFTVWYFREGRLVGVLAHERDEDYERGRLRIAAGETVAS